MDYKSPAFIYPLCTLRETNRRAFPPRARGNEARSFAICTNDPAEKPSLTVESNDLSAPHFAHQVTSGTSGSNAKVNGFYRLSFVSIAESIRRPPRLDLLRFVHDTGRTETYLSPSTDSLRHVVYPKFHRTTVHDTFLRYQRYFDRTTPIGVEKTQRDRIRRGLSRNIHVRYLLVDTFSHVSRERRSPGERAWITRGAPSENWRRVERGARSCRWPPRRYRSASSGLATPGRENPDASVRRGINTRAQMPKGGARGVALSATILLR